MTLSLGLAKEIINFEPVEHIYNIQISKTDYGKYRLTIKDSKNIIIDDVKSYSLLNEDDYYLYLKVEDNNGENIILEINKALFPKNIQKKKYLFYKDQEVKYIESSFEFVVYSKDGKFQYTSLYDSLEDTCILSYVKTEYKNLSKEDKVKIRKFFGINIKNMLLSILNLS